MALRNVILEIGTEELPSRFLPETLRSLERLAVSALSDNRLGFKDVRTYATPRRLVLHIRELDETQSSSVSLLKGPPLASAYDSKGEPTRAALGFAKSKGVEVDSLGELEVDGVKYVAAEVREESRHTLDVLPGLLRGLVEGLSFPKSMYWADPGVRFARPIRWLLALADDAVVPFEYGDVRSGRTTSGHRFMGQRSIERSEEHTSELQSR